MMPQIDKYLPVLVNNEHVHLVARATIFLEEDKVTITIVAERERGAMLAEILSTAEPMALAFVKAPAAPIEIKEI